MAATSLPVRSESKSIHRLDVSYGPTLSQSGRTLTRVTFNRNEVSDWITNDEGQQAQKRVWADIAKELERAVPGSITSIL